MPIKKTVIITGAASGIGLAAVDVFKKDSKYFIYAVDKNSHVLNLADDNVFPVQLNLTDKRGVLLFIQKILEEQKSIDVLINNAGILNVGRTNLYYDEKGEPKDEYKKLWETDYDAPIYLINLVLPIMRNKKQGTIMTVTSTKEYVRDPYHEIYADCKSALTKKILEIRKQEKENNIRIVAVQPGNTKTNIDSGNWILGSDKEEASRVQIMNDWWRNFFGNNPKNVANTMYKIAEGRINKKRVFTGIDANLAYFAHFIPFWPMIFSFSYQIVLFLVKVALVKNRNRN